jgi:prepilin-type N-terminal cleavage/methylation domain-containing protein/prepilin-type processing-associated H-X9-DG protein
MSKKRRKGFTLIELLVVVAIIALLIAILIPSLGKARDRAKVVACASNLRQFHTAIAVYDQQYDGIMLPYVAAAGSFTKYSWCGSDVLGPTLGLNTNGSGAGNLYVIEKIQKMLICPAVIRPPIDFTATVLSTTAWGGCYAYNQTLGDCISGVGVIPQVFKTDTANPTPGMTFVKRATLPNTQLVMMDDRDHPNKDDNGFTNITNLVTPIPNNPDSTVSKGTAGTPHTGHKANMLFADGQIILGDPNLMYPDKANSNSAKNWIIESKSPITAANAGFPY